MATSLACLEEQWATPPNTKILAPKRGCKMLGKQHCKNSLQAPDMDRTRHV